MITVLNPIYSQCSVPYRPLLKTLLYVTKQAVYISNHHRKLKTYKAPMVARNGLFLSGFIPKIENHFKSNKNLKINKRENLLLETIKPGEPKLKGIEFRKDQSLILKNALKYKRGVILSPTGSGKSIMFLGIISANPGKKTLILSHSVSINQQIYDEAKHFFPEKTIRLITSGTKFNQSYKSCDIIISNIQTFVKSNPELYADWFDLTIIDEVHKFSSQYETIMKNNLSPLRYGFTATIPEDDEKRMNIEGYLGPIISKLSINQARTLDILAKPKIKLINVPVSNNTMGYDYASIYLQEIVKNKKRNDMIINEVVNNIRTDKSTMIMITNIKHGEKLKRIAMTDHNLYIPFIQGETTNEEREKIKQDLESKKIKTVISTVIFREGINIKSLDCVIMAFGGKSAIATIQTIGRSLRKTTTKNEALIIDFLDSARYLAEHAIRRLQIYNQNGWL